MSDDSATRSELFLLHDAVNNDDVSGINALAARGVDMNQTNDFGDLPLALACRRQKLRALTALLLNGASIDGVDGLNPPIFAAISVPAIKPLSLLLANGANVNIGMGRITPLHSAVSRGAKKCEKLLRYAAQVDGRDEQRRTPLMLACHRVGFNVAKLLLYYGADVHAVDCDNTSVMLHALIGEQHICVLRELMVKGANIEILFDEDDAYELIVNNRHIAIALELAGIAAGDWYWHESTLLDWYELALDDTDLPRDVRAQWETFFMDKNAKTHSEFADDICKEMALFDKERFRFIRQRALTLTMALHMLRFPALVSVLILQNAFLYTRERSMHRFWDLVCAAKHFHERKQ